MKVRLKRLERSRERFRFADAVYDSLGKVKIPLLTKPRMPKVLFSMDVVDADIPALLVTDIFDRKSLTPFTVSK